jgi:hypothetical protein
MSNDSTSDWNQQMAQEYQGLLALHSANREMPLDVAISAARLNLEEKRRQQQVPSDPPGSLPSPGEAAAFEPEPELEFDVIARVVRLEQIVDNLSKGTGMNGLLTDLGYPDGGADEPVVEDGSISAKAVIPDGYPMPSEELSEARQQYAESLSHLERMQQTINGIASGWRDLMINPDPSLKLVMMLMPLLDAVAEEVRGQLSIAVPKVTIPRSLAQSIVIFTQATSAERVALDEFLDWAMTNLHSDSSSERAKLIRSNLQAVGLL